MSGLIFQCTHCRALVVASAVVADARDGTRAGLSCSACGATCWLPVAGARVDVSASVGAALPALPPAASSTGAPALLEEASAPAASPPVHGPWDASQRARIEAGVAEVTTTNDVQEALRASFIALWPRWMDGAAHVSLLKRAATTGDLAIAGQCYRVVAGVVPDDEPTRAAQQELLRLAMATMNASRDLASVQQEGTSSGVRTAALVGLVVLALVGAMMFSRVVNQLVAPQQQGGP